MPAGCRRTFPSVRPDILILGQGLAGTLLAWELEQAGVAFVIVESSGGASASLAGAGLVNPITGRRLVKSWRVDDWLPLARATYREIEAALNIRVWHDLRVRRLFADAGERATFERKAATGELAPFARAADADGFWIEQAARVDVAALLRATRERWQVQGRWREAWNDSAEVACRIDCRGLAGADEPAFGFVPWEFSRGELLELAVDGLESDVVLNRRHWIVPVALRTAWAGATHEPGIRESASTAAGRCQIEGAVAELLAGRTHRITGQRAGIRVNLPDRRPVAGRHPEHPRRGLINGLAAKGALWAPVLARQWREHLVHGRPFDAEIDAARFWARRSSQASVL